jgi:ATP-dependent DNA ligase
MAKKKPTTSLILLPVKPLKPTLVSLPLAGDQWIHEIKYDGYRLLCYLDHGKVTLRTKSRLDWTARYPELAQAVSQLRATQAVLDTEMAVLLPDGISSFSELHRAMREKRTDRLVLFAFDLLFVDGADLRKEPLAKRKQALAKLLRSVKTTRLQLVTTSKAMARRSSMRSARAAWKGSSRSDWTHATRVAGVATG